MKLTHVEKLMLAELLHSKLAESEEFLMLDPAAALAWEQQIDLLRGVLEKVEKEQTI